MTDLEAGVTEYGRVVTPGWCGEVDDLGCREETPQEGTSDAESTSAGNGLDNSDLFAEEHEFNIDATKIQIVETHRTGFQWCAVSPIGQESGVLGEFWETGNSKVFLVRVRRSNEVLSLKQDASIGRKSATITRTRLLHRVQDIGFTLIVPVSTNSKVNLAGVFVSLESLCNT